MTIFLTVLVPALFLPPFEPFTLRWGLAMDALDRLLDGVVDASSLASSNFLLSEDEDDGQDSSGRGEAALLAGRLTADDEEEEDVVVGASGLFLLLWCSLGRDDINYRPRYLFPSSSRMKTMEQ